MAIRTFSEYLKEQRCVKAAAFDEQSVSKTLEFSNDGFEIFINITLSRHEQHSEVIRFLRRVADELSVFERATGSSEEKAATCPRL